MKCNHEPQIEQFKKQLRQDMETRWTAVKASQDRMLTMLEQMMKIDKIEDIPAMQKTAGQIRTHLQTQAEEVELSTMERPKLMN